MSIVLNCYLFRSAGIECFQVASSVNYVGILFNGCCNCFSTIFANGKVDFAFFGDYFAKLHENCTGFDFIGPRLDSNST